MKANIKTAIWSEVSQNGADLNLDKNDINHLRQIYQKYNVAPETLEYVSVEFLLQQRLLSRFIIKELDILLSVNGIFEVTIVNSKSHSHYFRSRDQVKHEFSIATNGRYKLFNVSDDKETGVINLKYKKCFSTRRW